MNTLRKLLSSVLVAAVVMSLIPAVVLAAPSGKVSNVNCWDTGGQIEVSLSGCSGYETITVVVEFNGTVSSASGWGFDTYEVSGSKVTATVSASGANSWGFDSTVGIQCTGSGISDASLVSVTGDGESGSVSDDKISETTVSSGNSESTGGEASEPAATVKGVAGDDWLTTDGSKIVDMNGMQVWITGINWFGYNTGTNLFDGVWNCNLQEALEGIADHGFNFLRIPMSAELLLQWKNGEYPEANYNHAYNSELESMNSLEIFDYVLSLCEQYGMKVMIDIHSANTDASGHMQPLWYTDKVSTEDYIAALFWVAARYANNDTILAYDLKNEPHGKASETEHAIWNDSEDDNNWKYVAECAANAILDENPNALIVVEGIQIYPTDIDNNNYESTNDEDYYNTWWGANLMAVEKYPIDLGDETRNKQIVYSPHDYGPLVYEQPWFEGGDFTYDSLMEEAWHDYWFYIVEEDIAPILIGEWGGFMQGDNLKWMEYLRQLISEYNLAYTFWCYNANSGDTGGLVKDDFQTWDEEKYAFVEEVLWKNSDGKFIGLDHEIPLGKNGISLSEYSGKTVEPVETVETGKADSNEITQATEAPATPDEVTDTTSVSEESGDAYVIAGQTDDTAEEKDNTVAIVFLSAAGVCALAVIVVMLIKLSRLNKRKKDI